MLGGLKVKKDPESWLGLIDGIYSVSMTLLIVESPSLILKVFKKYAHVENHADSFFEIAWVNIFLSLRLLAILVLMFSIFIICCDTWSFQRKQIKNMDTMDQLHSFYQGMGLFLIVAMPSIFIVRFETRIYSGYTAEDTLINWAIVISLFLVYILLLVSEKREHTFSLLRGNHRRKRINNFSIITLQRRLSFGISIALLVLISKFLGAPQQIAEFFLPIIATKIMLDRSFRNLKRSSKSSVHGFQH
jgi:hypothetical protein